MQFRTFFKVSLLLVMLTGGVWLLSRPGTLPPENATRHQALRQLAAPAGEQGDGASTTPTLTHQDPVTPTTVNLADVPVTTENPDSLFNRWQRGEADLDETESRVSAAELAALQTEALAMDPSPNVQDADAPLPAVPAPDVAFDALDYTNSGGSVPPDPIMAAGPNHIIAAVNVSFAIYDKTGAVVRSPTSLGTFFSSNTACTGLFDPTVLYDEEADRFLLGVDAGGHDYCLAVTATGDPNGQWYLYNFATDVGGTFHDYPHLGVGRDAIYMGANQFQSATGPFVESRVWALDRAAMYAGNPAGSVTASTGNDGTPQPMHLHGYDQGTWPTSGPHYFVTDPYDGATLTLWRWNNALGGGTPSVVATYNLQTETGVASGLPVSTPQNGGSNIQANDFRFRGLEYRNGYLWTTDSISCNPGGGTVNCIRYAAIDLDTLDLVQSGVYVSNGQYRIFPDLVANHCEDMMVGYTKSSDGMYPAAWVTGRMFFDAPGMLRAETELKAGELPYNAFDPAPRRWGDYSAMTIDPDGLTFWYIGEYSKDTGTANGRWGNYIGSFRLSESLDCPVVELNDLAFLPIISKSDPPAPPPPPPADGPEPGFWQHPAGGVEFYVTPDSSYVDDFAVYVAVDGCGNYKITHTPQEPIVNGQFSFDTAFYASGTFDTTTSAFGSTGLDNFFIPGCGNVSGGPFNWTADWVSDAQPTLSGTVTDAIEITPAEAPGYEVTPLE